MGVPSRATSSSMMSSQASTTPTASEPGPTSSPEPSAPSKIWIVGAVLGPVAGCVLVGALVFFLVKRKYRAKSSREVGPHGYPHDHDQMASVGDQSSVAYRDSTITGNGKTTGIAPYGHDQSTAGGVYDFDQPVRVR